MISAFKIKNFKSILNLNLDFKFDEGKAPNGYRELDTVLFLEPKKNNRYIPCLSIYGANASGKTNIIKALDVFKTIIMSRIDNLYLPNKINTKYETTLFELSFFLKNKEYTYALEYNKDTIVTEQLKENDNTVFEITLKNQNFVKISEKGYTEQRLKEILNVECCDTNKNQKITFLNRLATNYSGLNKTISIIYNTIKEDIEIYPINMFPLSFGMEKLAVSQDYNAINASFEKITSLLRKLDIDIERMQLDRNITKLVPPVKQLNLPSQPDNISLRDDILSVDYIYSYHKDIDGNDVKFKFTEESEGTQIIAGLLGIFLSALDRGATLVIDELERSLHPLLLTEVIRLFKDKRYNTNNAQLIFTAHNTDILDADLLRVSEVAVVKKNIKEGTVLTRVSAFEGIRNVTNFRKQYLNGAFSGIPHPYI